MVEIGQNFMDEANIQIGQHPLELPKRTATFTRLLQRYDDIIAPRSIQQNNHPPEIVLFVAMVRIIPIGRYQREHPAIDVVAFRKFGSIACSQVVGYPLDIIHYRRYILENMV